eukprot:CAMPEP_0202862268 /NCGR_PEP_ID=MMETSP1391-20130828/3375_1 /ASSEMBLY_ACC=CAM_ASM_000867 /TAXON_ID=1034604 /ORGANISM="Chlamydomonas leiostraca, Strain SAG 11-49" /LENGTH=107 /DNA_ID=CAMNT_0049541783 /DNA_START=579 /DNA_END=903 /DNA_ORIENTATION=-
MSLLQCAWTAMPCLQGAVPAAAACTISNPAGWCQQLVRHVAALILQLSSGACPTHAQGLATEHLTAAAGKRSGMSMPEILGGVAAGACTPAGPMHGPHSHSPVSPAL